MKHALLLSLTAAAAAFAQGKVPQQPAGADCTSGAFKAGAVRVCTLSDALSAVPIVRVGNRNEKLDLQSSGLGWVGLSELKDKSLWVGVLDWQVESSGEVLELLLTTDAGKSWTRLPAVKKPHYLATFHSLELVSPRHWTLKIALDDCADCGVPLGTRVYETHDAGAHWALATAKEPGQRK